MQYKKIFYFLKNLKNIKFNLNKKKIVVFDGECFSDLKYTIENYDYFILEDRIHRINTIYISPSIIYYFFLYLFLVFRKYSIKVIYTVALIKSLKPKVVITSIDNSINFFLCAKVLSKEIFFLVLQSDYESGFREIEHDLKHNLIYRKNYKDLLYIPNFICFGQNDVDGAVEQKLKIEKFYKYGSIRISNFLHYIQKNNIKLNKTLFDICFISSPGVGVNISYRDDFIEEGIKELLKFTIRFAIQNNLKFVFAARRFENTSAFKSELDFYKPHLSSKELEFLILNINKKKNRFSSYFALLQSNVAVSNASTFLYDKIGLNEKILSCNFSGSRIFDFPITGICSMNNYNYDDFSSRLKLILNLNKNEYLKMLDQNPDYVMEFDERESVIQKTRKIIEKNF